MDGNIWVKTIFFRSGTRGIIFIIFLLSTNNYNYIQGIESMELSYFPRIMESNLYLSDFIFIAMKC